MVGFCVHGHTYIISLVPRAIVQGKKNTISLGTRLIHYDVKCTHLSCANHNVRVLLARMESLAELCF